MTSYVSLILFLSTVSAYVVAAQRNESRTSTPKTTKKPSLLRFKELFEDRNSTSHIRLCDKNETLDSDFLECLDKFLDEYLAGKERELGKANVETIKARFKWIGSSQVCWKSFAYGELPIVRRDDSDLFGETIYEDLKKVAKKTMSCVMETKALNDPMASTSRSDALLIINPMILFALFALFLPFLWQLI